MTLFTPPKFSLTLGNTGQCAVDSSKCSVITMIHIVEFLSTIEAEEFAEKIAILIPLPPVPGSTRSFRLRWTRIVLSASRYRGQADGVAQPALNIGGADFQ